MRRPDDFRCAPAQNPFAQAMKIIRCDPAHAGAILAIFNEAIVNSTALYDYRPRTPAMMESWFEAKAKGRYPVIGAVNDAGDLMGFASYGTFRAWPAYKYSVEHSVYVDARFRRQGLGKTLLGEIVSAATAQDYHMLIGGIDATNAVSIALHRRLGFSHCASIKQAGFKFGRWLDLEFYQLLLSSPARPVDG
jgi:phosphinothricin acetyltransferase